MSDVVFPLFVISTACAIGAALLVLAYRVKSAPKKLLFLVSSAVFFCPAFLLLLMLYPELVDTRHRAYKRFYQDIRVGMTRDQVFELMDAHYPTRGERLRPTVLYDEPGKLGFFMNPEKQKEPNCEGILLSLREQRVIEKRYSSD